MRKQQTHHPAAPHRQHQVHRPTAPLSLCWHQAKLAVDCCDRVPEPPPPRGFHTLFLEHAHGRVVSAQIREATENADHIGLTVAGGACNWFAHLHGGEKTAQKIQDVDARVFEQREHFQDEHAAVSQQPQGGDHLAHVQPRDGGLLVVWVARAVHAAVSSHEVCSCAVTETSGTVSPQLLDVVNAANVPTVVGAKVPVRRRVVQQAIVVADLRVGERRRYPVPLHGGIPRAQEVVRGRDKRAGRLAQVH
mmetsp:Transcript_8918/g.13048  ORF Transcript_8918/g.13048 Transcript_8918/m.13048 type:complete len:249 (-) Transcript_8918:41-787(-)